MRILLDQNTPRGLRTALPEHEVTTAREAGWLEVSNGLLLAAAERAGFDLLITADQNLRYQQNFAGRRLAILVLDTNNWPRIRRSLHAIREALERVEAGSWSELRFDRDGG